MENQEINAPLGLDSHLEWLINRRNSIILALASRVKTDAYIPNEWIIELDWLRAKIEEVANGTKD